MKEILVATSLFLVMLLVMPSVSVADPDMPDTTGGGSTVFVEGYQVNRWDDTNRTGMWDQDTDDLTRYACGWMNNDTAVCRDYRDGARYVCKFTGGRVFCQHDGQSGVAMAADERQVRANTLARGIANRGQVPLQQSEGTPYCS